MEQDELALSVLALEEWIDSRGWDEAPMVLALTASESAAAADKDGLEFVVLGVGDPYELVSGATAEGLDALVVSAELWAWPPGLSEDELVGRPSEHPDRIEVRSVVALAADGTMIGVARRRGEDPVVESSCGGPLVDAMRAVFESADR